MRRLSPPPTYHLARPRYFGLAPRGLVGALAGAVFAGAIAAAATGSLAVALLLLVAAGLLAALYVEHARRLRSHTRGLVGFAVAWCRAWTQAGLDVARFRLEAHRLGRQRRSLQYELGDAAFADDVVRMDELRRRLQLCTDRADACRAEAQAVRRRARRVTARERLAAARTQVREP
jgi:hypothetical protein